MAIPFNKGAVIITYHAIVQDNTGRPSRELAKAKSGDLQKRFGLSRMEVDVDISTY